MVFEEPGVILVSHFLPGRSTDIPSQSSDLRQSVPRRDPLQWLNPIEGELLVIPFSLL